MSPRYSRRDFAIRLGGVLGGAAAATLSGAGRRLKIGHTGITWGFRPQDAAQAIPDVAGLGYHGYESFGNVLESWEAQGGLGQVLEQNRLQLVSAYCGYNMLDPDRRRDEVGKVVRWGGLIKKYGGSVAVLGPTGVKRESFDFRESKPAIVAALNETAKALAGIGITGVLHQHTGTCVESRDEVYAVMDAVDTNYVKFGPDVGQLQKGGVDPVKVVSDFSSLIEHVHLKDYSGGPDSLGYCPLGQGKVEASKILDLLEKSKIKAMIMVELDPPVAAGTTPRQTAEVSKAYLQKMGYQFRS
jgi:inosose dehydratase